MPPRKKTVLITGCSADGVGATLAYTLAEQGHHVYATARNTAKIPPAVRELDNVTTLQLDVASAASITAASKAVREAGRGLDVLVNNAGEEVTAPLLDLDVGEGSVSRDVFEVNVWGPLRLVQTFVGLLVESRGRVVNMTSVDVELCPPWIGRGPLWLDILSEDSYTDIALRNVYCVQSRTECIFRNSPAGNDAPRSWCCPDQNRHNCYETSHGWAKSSPPRGVLLH